MQLKFMRTTFKSFLNKVFTVAISAALSTLVLFAIGDGNRTAIAADALVGDPEKGAEQFEATCAECHGAAATAPTLRGVIGREVASVDSFTVYSEGLKAKKPMKWTKDALDAYITAPSKFVPGSLMFRAYPDAQMRADVIAFIETLPPPRE